MLEFPFIKLDKIKVIYNGVNELDFYTREEARRLIVEKLDLNISAGALVELLQSTWIGTISELHYNKGVDVALTAFADVIKKYPKTALMIIGEGEERARLAEEIIKSNLSDHVFLVGFITDAKKYLKAFDIFTLTSRTEALPYALLEAGLAGLPIVASDVGGIPEIISSEEVGNLIPVGQNNSAEINNILAKALENLIKNPEQAKILGQNLKHLVTTDFSAEKMCTETFYLYV